MLLLFRINPQLLLKVLAEISEVGPDLNNLMIKVFLQISLTLLQFCKARSLDNRVSCWSNLSCVGASG